MKGTGSLHVVVNFPNKTAGIFAPKDAIQKLFAILVRDGFALLPELD